MVLLELNGGTRILLPQAHKAGPPSGKLDSGLTLLPLLLTLKVAEAGLNRLFSEPAEGDRSVKLTVV